MKKNGLYFMLNVWVLLLMGCTTESFHYEDGMLIEGSEGGGYQPDPTIPDESGDLLDFTIAFDENDKVTYGGMTETVVTDSNDENYDDFIENSTFSSVVTITYNGTSAVVSNGVDGVNISQNGAHVVVKSTVKKVEYVLQGTTNDGSFKVYGDVSKLSHPLLISSH